MQSDARIDCERSSGRGGELAHYDAGSARWRRHAIAGNITVRGVEFVVIPKAEYLRMQSGKLPIGSVEAHAFVRQSIAADLRSARESAGLTQAQLALRMGKSQTMVSQAESGIMRVSERYVRAVLKACGLPMSWGASKPPSKTPSKPRKRTRRM
jgi:DNA-binding XRE family transcriptional regulator